MKRTTTAVAVAGILAAPAAFAQSGNVQLYGRANVGFDSYEAKGSGLAGADRDDRFRVFDNGSRVGLRGTEDLGNGLRALFQIETGVNIDNGSNTAQSGQPNSATGFWASRDSFVGLDSKLGRLTFGRQSIYWTSGVNGQFQANYVNTHIPWTGGTTLGRVSSGPAGLNTITRQNNTVQYTSPTFGGMTGVLSYSPNAQESVQGNSVVDTDGRVWGLTLRGTWGPIYAQADYANNQANSNKNGNPHADTDLYKVGASWGYMPGARVSLIWVRTQTNNAAGLTLGDEVHQDGWTLGWEHTFGNVQVLAQYGQTGDIKKCNTATVAIGSSCGNSGAKAWMVGARYLLSKRTWLYATYNEVKNEANNFVDYSGAGITSTTGAPVPYGADPRIIAVGLLHNF